MFNFNANYLDDDDNLNSIPIESETFPPIHLNTFEMFQWLKLSDLGIEFEQFMGIDVDMNQNDL